MAKKDLVMNVEDQMLVVLELMVRGEDILAHGAWETPVKRLAMKEYAVKIGNGYRITEAGRAFFAKSEGMTEDDVYGLEPPRPEWIITPLPDNAGLVVLRKNELTVSGYEAMAARWVPVAHGRMNDIDTLAILGNPDGLLQAMLDAAWAKGLRPSNESR